MNIPSSKDTGLLDRFTIDHLVLIMQELGYKDWRKVVVSVKRNIGPSYCIIEGISTIVVLESGKEVAIDIDSLLFSRCLRRINKRSKSELIEVSFTKPSIVQITELKPPENVATGFY